ncbi:MAG: hypothetical protein LBJ73_03140 [Rickettsiales bacterium]|jgi:hypothetical protein|nr:hypothetical protein [Rickettsiales bacterium]
MDKWDYELTIKLTRLGNRGVRKSIDLAKQKGVANPFVIDGKLMYKLPNGKISDKAA